MTHLLDERQHNLLCQGQIFMLRTNFYNKAFQNKCVGKVTLCHKKKSSEWANEISDTQ